MTEKIFESRALSYSIAILILSFMMLPIYWTLVTAFKPDVETYIFPLSISLKIQPSFPSSSYSNFTPSGIILKTQLL